MPASDFNRLTFSLPAARDYYREGSATLGGIERLSGRQTGLQSFYDTEQAQSGLGAAQAVAGGYRDLQTEQAGGLAAYARGLDPAAEGLRNKILSRGSSMLDSGLSGMERRRLRQGTRADFASRGRLRGNAAITGEAVALDRASSERQAFGQQQATAALSAGTQFDAGRQAAMGVLSDPSFANRLQGLSSGGYQVDPWNGYGADVANTNYNAEASQLMTRYNNWLALTTGGPMSGGAVGVGGRGGSYTNAGALPSNRPGVNFSY